MIGFRGAVPFPRPAPGEFQTQMPDQVRKQDLWNSLPPTWPEDLLPAIRAGVTASRNKLVVLDDDPTGTQTVYDLPVLTQWSTELLRAEMANDLACFYLLTNSRSLSCEDAVTLDTEIAANLKAASAATGRPFSVVSRSDSTLRGHFPAATDALAEELGAFDGVLLVPFFEAGGRFTINDVHYVAEGDSLIPAAETPFARDPAFGFRTSNLRDWAVEKSGGRLAAEDVTSISLDEIRRGGPEAVRERLLGLASGCVCAVNAATQRDLEVVVAAVSAAEANGRRFLFRTAASFVAVRLGLSPRPLLTGGAILGDRAVGGLTVVGSYVPKTTTQLEPLLADDTKEVIELNVADLLEPGDGLAAVREAGRCSLHQPPIDRRRHKRREPGYRTQGVGGLGRVGAPARGGTALPHRQRRDHLQRHRYAWFGCASSDGPGTGAPRRAGLAVGQGNPVPRPRVRRVPGERGRPRRVE